MAFQHACFFSYRHRPDEYYKQCIEDMYTFLSGRITLSINHGDVVRDKNRIQGGQFIAESIASDVCTSACMIMVYIPPYFDEHDTYCAREFRAMEQLEQRRLQLLGQPAFSLIIPIVLRGWDKLPAVVKNRRLAYNFEDYFIKHSRLSRHPVGRRELDKIAKYVADRFDAFEKSGRDYCAECPTFNLPAHDAISAWVRQLAQPKEDLAFR